MDLGWVYKHVSHHSSVFYGQIHFVTYNVSLSNILIIWERWTAVRSLWGQGRHLQWKRLNSARRLLEIPQIAYLAESTCRWERALAKRDTAVWLEPKSLNPSARRAADIFPLSVGRNQSLMKTGLAALCWFASRPCSNCFILSSYAKPWPSCQLLPPAQIPQDFPFPDDIFLQSRPILRGRPDSGCPFCAAVHGNGEVCVSLYAANTETCQLCKLSWKRLLTSMVEWIWSLASYTTGIQYKHPLGWGGRSYLDYRFCPQPKIWEESASVFLWCNSSQWGTILIFTATESALFSLIPCDDVLSIVRPRKCLIVTDSVSQAQIYIHHRCSIRGYVKGMQNIKVSRSTLRLAV